MDRRRLHRCNGQSRWTQSATRSSERQAAAVGYSGSRSRTSARSLGRHLCPLVESDNGQSVIINLGNIADAETRRLIGAMVLVQLEQAALSRTDISPADRRPFTVLVDERPSFAAQDDTIGTILSQTRKFNLRLYLAAQSTSQITSERLNGALENCRLNIVFGLGRDSAVQQSRHSAAVDPMLLKEAPLTEIQHGQYMPVPEQFESWTQDLMTLPQQVAYVKLHTENAVKVRTLSRS